MRSRAESPWSRTACISRALGASCSPCLDAVPFQRRSLLALAGHQPAAGQDKEQDQDHQPDWRSPLGALEQVADARLRLRGGAGERRGEGVEGHWYLAIKARPFRRNGAGENGAGWSGEGEEAVSPPQITQAVPRENSARLKQPVIAAAPRAAAGKYSPQECRGGRDKTRFHHPAHRGRRPHSGCRPPSTPSPPGGRWSPPGP